MNFTRLNLLFTLFLSPLLQAHSDLTLDEAVFRSLNHSPQLDIAKNEAGAFNEKVSQAQVFPNPVFSYEVEDFAGNNDWTGFNHREERYSYTQLFETANKRGIRVDVARYQYYAALVGYEVSKLTLLNRCHRAFFLVVAAQERLKLALDQAEIASQVLQIATKKVEAGKVSPIQQNKAEVAYSNATVATTRAQVDLINSKRRLSLLWASTCPDFEKVIFPFYEATPPISLEECLTDLCNQAEIVQSLYNTLNAEKVWHLEKANQVPDITVQIGYKGNIKENNQGLLAGVSIPIPLFNQNKGNIGRAYYELLKTGDQGRQLWLILESKLSISYEELRRAYLESEQIKNVSLPSAAEAFKLAQKGYQEGKFEYLDVLDAQRTLFEVKEWYIQSLINYHTSRADIDFLNSKTE